MEIKTKFTLDQDCYFLRYNKIVKGKIEGINIDISKDYRTFTQISITYDVKIGDDIRDRFDEKDCIFSSIEEVCEFLTQEAKEL